MRSAAKLGAYRDELAALVLETPWLMDALRAARSLQLASWCIGAGAIRGLVWDRAHGRAAPPSGADVDVVFFDDDPTRSNRADELALEERLGAVAPSFDWEVVNQAGPHHAFGQAIARGAMAFESLEAGIASWPEIATCVGVFLDEEERVHVVAPHGLDDLFALRVRYNPACGRPSVYAARLAQKRFGERWPRVVVEPAPEDA